MNSLATPVSSGPRPSLLSIAAPLALAAVELFHPRPHDLFDLDMRVWLPIHYLQIPLFPLTALSMALLARPGSAAATVCRSAMFVFAIAYTAFDTAAGVVTGELITAARASHEPDVWLLPVMTVWNNAIVGTGGGRPPVLGAAGTFAWTIGAIAAAISVRRAGAPWGPVILLVVSGVTLLVFLSHAFPSGPVTFGALAAASIWLRCGAPHPSAATLAPPAATTVSANPA